MLKRCLCGPSNCTVIWQRSEKKNATGPADFREKCSHAPAALFFLLLRLPVEAQLVILGGRQRDASPPLAAPRGKPVAGGRGSPSSCCRCLEEARGSEWSLPVTLNYLPECDCACWEEHSRLLRHCLCVQYLHGSFCSERVFVSQGLIFICCVSTRWRRSSREADTRNLAVSLSRHGAQRGDCLSQ